jgi:hypothetical protein
MLTGLRAPSLVVCCILAALRAASQTDNPMPVRFPEGSLHGFLALRATDGRILAAGDLTQVIHGDRVTSHLVFHFKDGSIDDERATFSQYKNFHLISDRHIQRGPAFRTPTDLSVNALSGQVTVRYHDKGKVRLEREHLDLPPDLANGVILDVIKNLPDTAAETKLSYLVATPKPKLIKLSVTTGADEPFFVAGRRHLATHFIVKIELGGLAGLIAPFIGKEPADVNVWIAKGEAPAFVKLEGPLYLGGPVWRVEMISPVW